MYKCQMLINNKWVECLDVGTTIFNLHVIMEVESGKKHYLQEEDCLVLVRYGGDNGN